MIRFGQDLRHQYDDAVKLEFQEGIEISNRFDLINSNVLSDITFLVGSEKHPIKAHKAYLIPASEVFKNMFCGELQEKNDVIVVDIEKDVFLEMLRYIYTKVVNINIKNVFQLMYAANKYIILPLEKLCGYFVKAETTESNALVFFEAAHLFNVPDVEKACMSFVLKNPIKYFEDPIFLDLSKTALQKIIQQPKINCTSMDLERVALKWLKNQDSNTPDDLGEINLARIGLKINDFRNKTLFNARVDETYFEAFKVQTMSYPDKKGFLYGLGIYSGVRTEPGDENVAIRIHRSLNSGPLLSIQRKITTTSTLSIENVMFPMLQFTNPMDIVIEFETSKERSVIHVPDKTSPPPQSSTPSLYNHTDYYRSQIYARSGVPVPDKAPKIRSTCIAYLITSE